MSIRPSWSLTIYKAQEWQYKKSLSNKFRTYNLQFIHMYYTLNMQKWNTLESQFNESQFNEIPWFSEQMPAPLNYFIILNLIQFSELHNLVNKSGLMTSFLKSRLGLLSLAKNLTYEHTIILRSNYCNSYEKV